MQSYIRTYYRLRKQEPLLALGSSHQGGLNFCIRGTQQYYVAAQSSTRIVHDVTKERKHSPNDQHTLVSSAEVNILSAAWLPWIKLN